LGEEIESAWKGQQKAHNLEDVGKKLDGVMDTLQGWSKRTIGSVSRKIQKLRKKLGVVSMYQDDSSMREKKRLSLEIDELLAKEELMWKQRSRVDWLKSGDQNTSYFHRKATWRAKKNNIIKLTKPNGVVTQDTGEIKEMTTDYFKNLYSKDDLVEPGEILNLLQNKISTETNEKLCSEFTEEEIGNALF
jgi:hypothetical protein